MRLKLNGHTTVAAAVALAAALASVAFAQSTDVIPPASANIAGDTDNAIPIGASTGGTYQVLFPPSQLVGVPIGGTITSIQMRLRSAETTPWPAVASVIASYEITMGGSTRTPATISTTLADNITNPLVVRSGPLNLAAGAYQAGPGPAGTIEPWGPVISFSTPYVYTGGPLVVEFRNTGAGGLAFGDAVSSTALGIGLGSISSSNATTGGLTGAVVIRLGVTPPGTRSATLPGANESVAGITGNYIPFAGAAGGRQMTLYAADQLAAIPAGSIIVGVQLRQRNAETAPYPAANFSSGDYEIWLCGSDRDPGSISSTFADNIRDAVRVRDGARAFTAGEFPGGAASGTTPEPWGPLIVFDTPYVYNGGVLGLEFRNTGGGPSAANAQFADIVTNSAVAAGVASTTSPTNPTGTLNGAIIARFTFVTPVESPFGDGVTKIYALKDFADVTTGSFYVGFARNADFTTQYLYGPEQFQTVGPGTLLTALSFRNISTTAWPPALSVYSQFDLRLSRSPLTPATISTTVATNSGADAVTVRSGVLGVPAGVMTPRPVNGTAPYTWTLPFTETYPYRTGTLDVLINNRAIATVNGQVDAISASSLNLQPFARGQAESGIFSAASVPVSVNVPVARFSADAQVMVPNSLKDGIGLGSSYVNNSPLDDDPSTFQVIIGASQLTHVPVGGVITSMSLLGGATAPAWPNATGATAEDFYVELSTAANSPENMSLIFSNNVGSDAIVVRTGPISWTPESLPAGSTERFGGTITFDRGFIYKGGPLCLTVRHSGVLNGSPILRAANPAGAVRVVRADGRMSSFGQYFGIDSGPAIQLGYVPSDVSPTGARFTEGLSGRQFFAPTRVYQSVYDAGHVGVPIGATINGISLRLDSSSPSSFPASDFSLDRFDITMSTAATSSDSMSDTFAVNEGADAVTVRSGPITIPAGAYSGSSANYDFGLFIPFTRPFVYRGGGLTMLVRSGGGGSIVANFDATSIGGAGRRFIGNADALAGSVSVGAIVARFAFTDDAFCPADLNNDGIVDDFDFQIFVLAYNTLDCADPAMAFGCSSDLNFDRIVNDDDFLPFVQAYNAVFCP